MSERTVIQSIVQRPLVSASLQSTVFQVAGTMTKANTGSILVIDSAGSMLGIFTERDVMTRVVAKGLDPETTVMADVMTKNPRWIPPETKVPEALLMMVEYGFRHLPILGPNGKILGVFSIRDATPHEISDANSMAEYLDKINDARG